MIIILVVSVVLVVACVVFHGYAVQLVAQRLFRKKHFSFDRVSILIGAAIVAHLIEIVMFQIAYAWLILDKQTGEILGNRDQAILD